MKIKGIIEIEDIDVTELLDKVDPQDLIDYMEANIYFQDGEGD